MRLADVLDQLKAEADARRTPLEVSYKEIADGEWLLTVDSEERGADVEVSLSSPTLRLHTDTGTVESATLADLRRLLFDDPRP